jgi:2-oxo-4-hydroxy-4-carboxy-5-ureidoimidazoline decarboxylase
VSLTEFNAASAETATAWLTACCDVPSWVAAVRDGRPYAVADDALDVADKAARSFTMAEVDRALAAHPRIGDRPTGPGRAAAWSRQEQSGVARDTRTQDELLEANAAYERRFGRVFLICATGLTGDEILATLRQRLGNDEASESAAVAEELRKVALLRLMKVLGS